jgi:hypothetical protein
MSVVVGIMTLVKSTTTTAQRLTSIRITFTLL